MRFLDSTSARVKPSMFLHGLTGSGKSTWACVGGKPLVILTEPKAESVLRQINPEAMGIVPESIEDLEKLIEILGLPEKTSKFDRIILDSFTEMTISCPRWIQKSACRTGILTKLELSEFGQLRDYALAVVKAIQLTGLPSVIIGRSVSKRTGMIERIVPDGTGRSVEELPGKLLPTAEARVDSELGFVIDTTPAEHSQRCGLRWLPPIVRCDEVSCLDYLRMIEATPADAPTPEPTKKPETKPSAPAVQTPAAPEDPEWVDLLARYLICIKHLPSDERAASIAEWEKQYASDHEASKNAIAEYLQVDAKVRASSCPDPETDPEGYQAAFGKMVAEMQDEKIQAQKSKAPDPSAAAFVDGVSPEVASAEEVSAVQDACAKNNVDLDAVWAYAMSKGQAKPSKDGSKNWFSLSKKMVETITSQLSGANRVAFVSWLHKTYKKEK